MKEKKAEKESRKRKFELVSFSNFKLLVFTTCLIAWCTVYQKLMAAVYFTEAWHLFDHFMKILINQASHHQRPLERNIFFNFMRCFFDEFLVYMVFETFPDTKVLLFRIFTVAIMTLLVQMYVNKKSIKRNSEEWAILQVFYLTSFGIQFTYHMSNVEENFRGNIARTVTFMGGLMMCYLFGDLVEDFFYDDINRWGGIWHNWGFFVAPFTIIVLGFFLAHFWIHWDKPNGALRHNSGIMFSLNHYSTPLLWPATKYDVHANEHWIIVLIANSMFGYSTLYYTILWKYGLRKEKPKRIDPALLENLDL